MNTSKTKRTVLVGASMLTAVLAAGCAEGDRPEIKRCSDAGGIPIRSVWEPTMLKECTFPPTGKAANAPAKGPASAGPA